jgi:hypothetical protein
MENTVYQGGYANDSLQRYVKTTRYYTAVYRITHNY